MCVIRDSLFVVVENEWGVYRKDIWFWMRPPVRLGNAVLCSVWRMVAEGGGLVQGGVGTFGEVGARVGQEGNHKGLPLRVARGLRLTLTSILSKMGGEVRGEGVGVDGGGWDVYTFGVGG